eukprot:CAMPEP_0170528736 /NCGR_PEP_ID=MMETSP0209-20121228/14220_1 /TAXON_ID=665100 ORGANISM="Litonotus pictus, Strain P1" /NCGR_SAMPLE_ID=MMETSP0209 /ASSEMBLY_ACC=CAM_ASM_000301 /LENGTH=547 /DNA_ID=CAMNT_0010820129 /DNA_START=68 /DNA_END=1711 /DNA_ORIENTATION=+
MTANQDIGSFADLSIQETEQSKRIDQKFQSKASFKEGEELFKAEESMHLKLGANKQTSTITAETSKPMQAQARTFEVKEEILLSNHNQNDSNYMEKNDNMSKKSIRTNTEEDQSIINKNFIQEEKEINHIKKKQQELFQDSTVQITEDNQKQKLNQTNQTLSTETNKKPLSENEQKKANLSLVTYVKKHFNTNSIIEFLATIEVNGHIIKRKFLLGDNIDLKMFSFVIIELFEFIGKSWKVVFPNFSLSSAYESEKVSFKTQTTEKEYLIQLVGLKKLKLEKGVKFIYIYDYLGEKWEVNVLVEASTPVNSLIYKKYKTQKDQNIALTKLKGLFRPILISGKNHAPPEGLGGPKLFKIFLKNLEDFSNPTTREHMSYYKTLIDDDLEENNEIDKVLEGVSDNYHFIRHSEAERYLAEFDSGAIQMLLSEIKFLDFYSGASIHDTVSDLDPFNDTEFSPNHIQNMAYGDDILLTDYSEVKDIVIVPKKKTKKKKGKKQENEGEGKEWNNMKEDDGEEEEEESEEESEKNEEYDPENMPKVIVEDTEED